jgi:hypothetical protein
MFSINCQVHADGSIHRVIHAIRDLSITDPDDLEQLPSSPNGQ